MVQVRGVCVPCIELSRAGSVGGLDHLGPAWGGTGHCECCEEAVVRRIRYEIRLVVERRSTEDIPIQRDASCSF